MLIIRGSNPEDSGVYVEGVRIPFIYHIGGYVSVFNPDLIGAVDYLPGNYGAQYGRTTGGVIDVKIKQEAPEQGRLVWSTDLLDSGRSGKSCISCGIHLCTMTAEVTVVYVSKKMEP